MTGKRVFAKDDVCVHMCVPTWRLMHMQIGAGGTEHAIFGNGM